MASVMETLANKKKPAAVQELTVLPVLEKDHEGECGEGCGCGAESEGGGCCGG